MTYTRMQVRDNLSVPAGVVAHRERVGADPLVKLLVPGFEHVIVLDGEAAMAWIAFEDGHTQCEVRNGVLDVIGGFENLVQAQNIGQGQRIAPGASLAQPGPSQQPRRYVFPDSTPLPAGQAEDGPREAPTKDGIDAEVAAYQTGQGRPGRVNYDAAKKRLLG